MVVRSEFKIRFSLAPSFSLPFLRRETLGTRLHSFLLLCISVALPRLSSSSPHRAAFHATSLNLSTLSPSRCWPRFPTCSEPKTSYTCLSHCCVINPHPLSVLGEKLFVPRFLHHHYTREFSLTDTHPLRRGLLTSKTRAPSKRILPRYPLCSAASS